MVEKVTKKIPISIGKKKVSKTVKKEEEKKVIKPPKPFKNENLNEGKKNPNEQRCNRWYDKILIFLLSSLEKIKILFNNKKTQIGVFIWAFIATTLLLFGSTTIIDYGNDESETTNPCISEIRMVDKIESEVLIRFVKPTLDPYVAKVIGDSVDKWAPYYKIPKEWPIAVMGHESEYNPLARSSKGAIGLMQILPRAHKERFKGIPKEELYHIDKNIKFGCEILAYYLELADGNYYKAMHRYLGLAATYNEINAYSMDVFNRMSTVLTYEASLIVKPKVIEEDEDNGVNENGDDKEENKEEK